MLFRSAGLTCTDLVAPWVIKTAMDRTAFDTYIETQPAPALDPGTVVILDNLATRKSQRAMDILKRCGGWLRYLPACSPDPCVAKNSPPDCFLYAPHRSGSIGHSFGAMVFMPSYSPSSRRTSDGSKCEPSTSPSKPPALSAHSSTPTNAGTSSRPPDMPQIKRKML